MPVTAPSNSLGAWTAGTLPKLSANWIGTGYGPAGSAYVALRVTTVTASGTPSYQIGVTWEE